MLRTRSFHFEANVCLFCNYSEFMESTFILFGSHVKYYISMYRISRGLLTFIQGSRILPVLCPLIEEKLFWVAAWKFRRIAPVLFHIFNLFISVVCIPIYIMPYLRLDFNAVFVLFFAPISSCRSRSQVCVGWMLVELSVSDGGSENYRSGEVAAVLRDPVVVSPVPGREHAELSRWLDVPHHRIPDSQTGAGALPAQQRQKRAESEQRAVQQAAPSRLSSHRAPAAAQLQVLWQLQVSILQPVRRSSSEDVRGQVPDVSRERHLGTHQQFVRLRARHKSSSCREFCRHSSNQGECSTDFFLFFLLLPSYINQLGSICVMKKSIIAQILLQLSSW